MAATCLGHRAMLQDSVRVLAYRDAIHEAVHTGDVVLDLGSGTGLLGFFACQAGAERVYAVERREVVECARRLCVANGYGERMVLLKGDSLDVELPEPVDVIVSEMLGYFCLEEDLTRFVVDARDRFLKPGGTLVPAEARMFVAPVEASQAFDEHIGWWNSPLGGLDYSLVTASAADERYVLQMPREGILSEPACVKELDFSCAPADVLLDRDLQFVVERKGVLHGLAGWFDARLSHSVHLSTAPGAPATHWKQTFFPVAEPVPVEAGDLVAVRLKVIVVGSVFWEWNLRVFDADRAAKAHIEQSNFSPDRESIVSRMPGFQPRLSEAGLAMRHVLAACDGKASLRDIARGLAKEYPALVPTEASALRWVSSSLKGKLDVPEKLSDLAKVYNLGDME